jgi:E3 ubiquitin-protein ligase HUWE1
MHGPQKLQIHRISGGPQRLPSAHTCVNQLDLPEYDSFDQLRSKLHIVLQEGSEGFAFA